MVIKIKSQYATHTSRASQSPGRGPPPTRSPSLLPRRIRATREQSDSKDVIDLGAPRGLLNLYEKQASKPRRRLVHTPNPRLYRPPPPPPPPPSSRPKRRAGPRCAEKRAGRRRRPRVFRRFVPNPRLYRPVPARPPPPPLKPRVAWSPPAPTVRLETASHVALRLADGLPRDPFIFPPTSPSHRPNVQSGRTAAPGFHSSVIVNHTAAPRSRVVVPLSRAAAPGFRIPALLSSTAAPRPRNWFPPVSASRVTGQRLRASAAASRTPSPAPYAAEQRLYPVSQTRGPRAPHSRRLVVTLPQPSPAVRPPDALPRYRPASAHFRSLSLDTDTSSGTSLPEAGCHLAIAQDMESSKRHSASPEDRSEANESAPSEFLAEFLSAIMRRQYAEALKYCRLILQYEPHNATARGFYPLLEHKMRNKAHEGARRRASSSDEASAPTSEQSPPAAAPPTHELMEQGDDDEESSGASCGSQSSLELDSSEAAAPWSNSASPSHRTERSDSASGGRWDSSGGSRSEDDNGNAAPLAAPTSSTAATPALVDLNNDNASLASLRRLRAQFTCSIK